MLRFVAAASAESRRPSGPGSAGRGRAPGRVRAACFAPLLGYWILVTAVIINPQLQWSLAVFGPILVLMAWLIVLRGSDARPWISMRRTRQSFEEEVHGTPD